LIGYDFKGENMSINDKKCKACSKTFKFTHESREFCSKECSEESESNENKKAETRKAVERENNALIGVMSILIKDWDQYELTASELIEKHGMLGARRIARQIS
jgi:hypothetical protein